MRVLVRVRVATRLVVPGLDGHRPSLETPFLFPAPDRPSMGIPISTSDADKSLHTWLSPLVSIPFRTIFPLSRAGLEIIFHSYGSFLS